MYMPDPSSPHTTQQLGELALKAGGMVRNATADQLRQMFSSPTGGGTVQQFYDMIRDNPHSAEVMKSLGYGSLVR
jgi:hypothetical protein